MPWKENGTMDLRVQLIRDYDEGESIAALAAMYGVARKTVYKWLGRHAAEGAAGLADRSRVPLHSPGRLTAEVMAHILAARHRWKWGPRKLRVKLAAAHPSIAWPAESTIGEVLKRAGLTHPRKPRVRTPPYARPFASVDDANQTWCADFKGHFRTADGTRCDPLTITDAHSRYLLRCRDFRRRVSRARLAAGDPHRQRRAVRQPRAGRSQPRVDGVGEAGHCARTFASRLAAGQRPARAHAFDAEAGDVATAGAQPAPSAGSVRPVSARVQSRTSA